MPLLPKLRNLAAGADALSDRARARLGRLRQNHRKLMIEPYAGYGSAAGITFGGRVLVDEGFVTPDASHGRWRNLVEIAKRLESDEVPGARVRINFQRQSTEVVADEEGRFRVDLVPAQPELLSAVNHVELELIDPAPAAGQPTPRAQAQVIVPRPSARFGVISDIDDTVLQSNVMRRWTMLKTLATNNAHSRKPFAGVAVLYQALQAGANGEEGNPLFYVSSSPWNLYAMLREFLHVQELPAGPVLLKDFGEHTLFTMNEHGEHKLARIEEVFKAYPALPFILVGDSGEQDPEIYAEVVRHHPQRVKAIYIRSVDTSAARLAAVDQLIASVRASGAQLVLVPDSEFAAVHAAGEGWISPAAVAAVRADVRADKPGATAADDSPP
ncbi:MAG TPA: phosphatase domain-containing protein [Rubrivivax sp.]|nr:phosphatase domain-containing protein [Rubrivivax sp.]